MWIEKTTSAVPTRRLELSCDECGNVYAAEPSVDRRTKWHRAGIAGWARIARAPERHICPDC